jgi:hypothetical protein
MTESAGESARESKSQIWSTSSYTLTIRREKQANDEEKTGDVLYKGVA